MSVKKSKIEHLIQKHLLDEGLLREKMSDPDSKLEFGFIFSFPPGQEELRMNVYKPIKRDYIKILIRTKLPKSGIKALNSLNTNI